MSRSMKPTKLPVLLLTLVTLPAFAFVVKKDSTGTPVTWQQKVVFHVDPAFDSALGVPGAFDALSKGIENYRENANVSLDVRKAKTTGMGVNLDSVTSNENDIVVLDEWPYDAKALAVTIITYDASSHRIVDADIAFNRAHYKFDVLPANSVRGGVSHDVQNTFMHELGHALGLEHTEAAEEAVMYGLAYPGEVNKRTFATDDREALASLYTNAPGTADDGSDDAQAAGCSSTGTPGLFALVAVLALALRRQRVVAAAVGSVAVLYVAHASQASAQLSLGDPTVVEQVVLTRSTGVFESEVTLRSEVTGERVTVRWPGGKHGNFEQVVADAPVPSAGAVVYVKSVAGSLRMVDGTGQSVLGHGLHLRGIDARIP